MTTFTLHHAASSTEAGGIRRIWTAVTAFVASVVLAVARAHEVQHLMTLSDSTLAQRGLRRDGIVQHVMAKLPD